MNIKAEPQQPSACEVTESSHDNWQKEKEGLIYQIDNLKSEHQRVVSALKQLKSEFSSMSLEKAKLEEEITAKNNFFFKEKEELQMLLTQQQTKFDEMKEIDTKTIENMMKENKMLVAKIKQLQSGIAHQQSFENNDKKSTSNVRSIDDDLYEVDAIIDHKGVKNHRQYLVRWKNFGPNDDSWERESNLNCPAILKKYKKTKNLK